MIRLIESAAAAVLALGALLLFLTGMVLRVVAPGAVGRWIEEVTIYLIVWALLLTPPVGLNLFVLSSVSRTPVSEVIHGVVPFLLIMAVLLLLVTYIPAISLTVPNYVFD